MNLPSIKITYGHFDKLGEFFTSLAAVIVGMLFFVGYRFFEVYTLFERHLPKTQMDEAAVVVASKLIAFVVIFIMLLISVNLTKFKYENAAVFLGFFITFFVNLFFWMSWKNDPEYIIFSSTISLFTALFDTGLSYLFIKKWNERQHKSNMEHEIAQLEQSVSSLKQLESTFKGKYQDLGVKVAQRTKMLEETTCPKCGDGFQNARAVRAHIGKCKG